MVGTDKKRCIDDGFTPKFEIHPTVIPTVTPQKVDLSVGSKFMLKITYFSDANNDEVSLKSFKAMAHEEETNCGPSCRLSKLT